MIKYNLLNYFALRSKLSKQPNSQLQISKQYAQPKTLLFRSSALILSQKQSFMN